MFGGLPTPTESDAPDNVLTVSSATNPPPLLVAVHDDEYQQNADDSNHEHQEEEGNIGGHLTTSQSAHITLRLVLVQ